MSKEQPMLALLVGGASPEHLISIRSAKSVIKALMKSDRLFCVVFISNKNQWFMVESKSELFDFDSWDTLPSKMHIQPVFGEAHSFVAAQDPNVCFDVDVFFPLLHGAQGEDGVIQGVLEMLGRPYVGCDVLSSSLCMNKCASKKILYYNEIPVSPYVEYKSSSPVLSFQQLVTQLGLPFFVKPASAGSSLGVSRIDSEDAYHVALSEALKYDHTLLFEKGIIGRELECAVMGNADPVVSQFGEIVLGKGSFYDYTAKYSDSTAAQLVVPALIEQPLLAQLNSLAVAAYKALGCSGMARVDFLVDDLGQPFINEVNTIPGFTSISLYPRLWLLSGYTMLSLVDALVNLALEKHADISC